MFTPLEKDELVKAFLQNFVQKERRERSYYELNHSQKRWRFPDRMNHCWDSVLDMRYITQVPSESDAPAIVQKMLGLRNDELCYAISNYAAFDDRLLPFGEVFPQIYSRGLATILLNRTADMLFLDTEQENGAPPRFVGKRLKNR